MGGWDATPVRLKCLAKCDDKPAPTPPPPHGPPAPKPSPSPAGCKDGSSQCSGWAKAGYCAKYNVRANSGTMPMKDFCKKSCGGCGNPPPGPSPSPNNNQELATKKEEERTQKAKKKQEEENTKESANKAKEKNAKS